MRAMREAGIYTYVFNNPVNFSDPIGLIPATQVKEIVAVLAGLGYTQAEIDAAIAYLAAGGAQ